MSRKPFVELLKDRVVIFDGAMGTELYRRHQFVNVCFEELCVSKPDLVKEIHEANKIAGADVLTTNSFGANRYKLGGHLLADKVAEISRKAARIAREVAGDELYVAGSVGPLGKTIGIGGVSHEEAVSSFADSILGLKEGGADFIIFETFGRGDELLAAISAAQIVDMPYIPSMAIAEHKLTRHGESIEDFFNLLREGAAKPMALGFNCGVGPREMLEQLAGFIPDSPYPVLTQPNAGYPRLVHDRMIYMTSPEYLSTYASHFVQLGVRAVGGCCGTGPEHVKALADGVKSVHRARAVSNVNLNKDLVLHRGGHASPSGKHDEPVLGHRRIRLENAELARHAAAPEIVEQAFERVRMLAERPLPVLLDHGIADEATQAGADALVERREIIELPVPDRIGILHETDVLLASATAGRRSPCLIACG